MSGSLRRGVLRALVVLAVVLLLGLESGALAQSRRVVPGDARRGTPLPDDAIRTSPDPRSVFAPGQAPAGQPSPFAVPVSPFNGTANRQVRRYRGDNNEILGEIGPSGRNVGGNAMSPSMGFTLDKVHEGYYMPGFGVNGGFAAPERVHGGFYTPGWGVMGGVGNFNGAAATQQLRGGTFIPGFGVGGGPAVIGNTGGAVIGGFSPVTSGASVSGGNFVPGFGVTGGR